VRTAGRSRANFPVRKRPQEHPRQG
jgi:hypothetical protein